MVEIWTIQALTPDRRNTTISKIADTVAAGGALYLQTVSRPDDAPARTRPWPVSRQELSHVEAVGLRRTGFAEDLPGPDGRFPVVTVYTRD